MDSDGFRIVSSKGKRISKARPSSVPQYKIRIEEGERNIDSEKVKRRIQSAVEDLRISQYWKDFGKSVSTVLQSRQVVETVCFGLGHFSECNISLYQLAFLLCVKDIFKPEKVFVHDPVFYKGECDLLKLFELHVIEQNKEGCYIISDKGISLIYLPHCPKQLTNNFLWTNWNPNLSNCTLICNSFTSLLENQPSRILTESVPYICKIYPFINEIPLKNNFIYADIFNDTSIHQFLKEKLEPKKSSFWTKADKPKYDNAEEFITSHMIEKLNI